MDATCTLADINFPGLTILKPGALLDSKNLREAPYFSFIADSLTKSPDANLPGIAESLVPGGCFVLDGATGCLAIQPTSVAECIVLTHPNSPDHGVQSASRLLDQKVLKQLAERSDALLPTLIGDCSLGIKVRALPHEDPASHQPDLFQHPSMKYCWHQDALEICGVPYYRPQIAISTDIWVRVLAEANSVGRKNVAAPDPLREKLLEVGISGHYSQADHKAILAAYDHREAHGGSVSGAVKAISKSIVGSGTDESRKTRLRKKYSKALKTAKTALQNDPKSSSKIQRQPSRKKSQSAPC